MGKQTTSLLRSKVKTWLTSQNKKVKSLKTFLRSSLHFDLAFDYLWFLLDLVVVVLIELQQKLSPHRVTWLSRKTFWRWSQLFTNSIMKWTLWPPGGEHRHVWVKGQSTSSNLLSIFELNLLLCDALVLDLMTWGTRLPMGYLNY